MLERGGSTSVGSNAIQLAVAAGYEVVTTASPRNYDDVGSLGAAKVFDYNSPTIVDDIVGAFHGRTLAGAIAIGASGAPSCVRIVSGLQGHSAVAVAGPPVSFDTLADDRRGRAERLRVTRRLISSNIALQVRSRTRGVRVKYIFGTSLKKNEVGNAIYRDFLPSALAEWSLPRRAQAHRRRTRRRRLSARDGIQRKGVSATKVVFTLPC